MRPLLDANLSHRLVQLLETGGHDVAHVRDLLDNLDGFAPDLAAGAVVVVTGTVARIGPLPLPPRG